MPGIPAFDGHPVIEAVGENSTVQAWSRPATGRQRSRGTCQRRSCGDASVHAGHVRRRAFDSRWHGDGCDGRAAWLDVSPLPSQGASSRLAPLGHSLLHPQRRRHLPVTVLIVSAWAVVFLAWWTAVKPDICPSPLDVLQAYPGLWTQNGLGQELLTSLRVNWEALPDAISLPRRTTHSRFQARGPRSAVCYIVLPLSLAAGHEVGCEGGGGGL
jgi:hypothetical protein